MRRPIGRHHRNAVASLWELLNLGSPEETAWMVNGLCAQTDPEAFFAERGGDATQQVRVAKAICARCPVEAECLVYALDHDERYGVWGGTSPRERRALRLRMADTAPAMAA